VKWQFRGALLALALVSLTACASLRANFENPSLEVTSIALLPSEGMQVNFDVGLKVSNPNRVALNVVGLAYDLSLDGFKIIQGVGNDIPAIPAYGDAEFHVSASTNLMQSFKLLSELMSKPKSILDYALNAKIDLGSTLLPALRLSDAGEINLSNQLLGSQ